MLMNVWDTCDNDMLHAYECLMHIIFVKSVSDL